MDKKTKSPAEKFHFIISVSTEKLNFIIAISAFLVSAASFYATYLQAKSAEQQVKAMTYPLIQFSHGNYNKETQQKHLAFKLKNSGVGPAIIKSVSYLYKGQSYPSFNKYLEACCEYKKMMKEVKDKDLNEYILTTSPVNNRVLAMSDTINFMSFKYHDSLSISQNFWQKLNKERWKLKLKVCYCSLIDDCYLTEKAGVVTEVKSCKE